jgi:regulator of PEP synthase PpsR (kinase-PPPase family)
VRRRLKKRTSSVRKSEKLEVVYVRIPQQIKHRIDAICDQEQLSLNRLLVSLLGKFVKSYAANQQNEQGAQ